jgi:hypothetical protein
MAYATVEEVAWALHLTRPPTGEDLEALEACIDAAGAEVDTWVDWPEGPDPDSWTEAQLALVNRVTVLRAVEWWKANDAAFGLIGTAELGQLRAPRDGFDRHRLTLYSLKQQWGVA